MVQSAIAPGAEGETAHVGPRSGRADPREEMESRLCIRRRAPTAISPGAPRAPSKPALRLCRILEPAQAAVELVQAAVDAVRVGVRAGEIVADAAFQSRQPALDPLQTAGVVVERRLGAVELGVHATQQAQRVAFRLLGHDG
jgi:hypothetical protein